jgi:hypothetical protein
MSLIVLKTCCRTPHSSTYLLSFDIMHMCVQTTSSYMVYAWMWFRFLVVVVARNIDSFQPNSSSSWLLVAACGDCMHIHKPKMCFQLVVIVTVRMIDSFKPNLSSSWLLAAACCACMHIRTQAENVFSARGCWCRANYRLISTEFV